MLIVELVNTPAKEATKMTTAQMIANQSSEIRLLEASIRSLESCFFSFSNASCTLTSQFLNGKIGYFVGLLKRSK